MVHKALLDFLNINKTEYRLNEPMCEHTSFKIGGAADIFIMPSSSEETAEILRVLNETAVPCFPLGKGSNLLVSDKGIEGAVLGLCKMDKIEVIGNQITAASPSPAGTITARSCR